MQTLNYAKQKDKIKTANFPCDKTFDRLLKKEYSPEQIKRATKSCRSVMNFYKNTEIHEHYTKNIKEQFANNSIAVFIKDLRNYQMHYKTTFPYLTSDKQICFETYEFKQYDRWSKLSKEFIKVQGDFIILKPLFETYFKMLEPFYMNIYAELTQYHKQDFRETIELSTKMHVAIPNIYFQLACCDKNSC